MTNAKPIRLDLRDAFEDAVANFSEWRRGEPEPPINLDRKTFTVDEICDFVTKFTDTIPEKVYYAICMLAQELKDGVERLPPDFGAPKDHTYASAGRCLCQMYSARKEYYFNNTQRHP